MNNTISVNLTRWQTMLDPTLRASLRYLLWALESELNNEEYEMLCSIELAWLWYESCPI